MSGIYKKFKESSMGGLNISSDTVKADLVNLGAVTSSMVKAITGATNATPIVVTATAHGFSNGDYVSISGVAGNTAANGQFKIASVATNTFNLTDRITGANVAGSGAYTSGGYAVNLSNSQYRSAVDAGARVATSAALSSKTFTLGVFTFASFTWSTVSGSACQAVILFDDTPATDATKNLIAIDDGATNLPVTPNGGNITYTPNGSGFMEL